MALLGKLKKLHVGGGVQIGVPCAKKPGGSSSITSRKNKKKKGDLGGTTASREKKGAEKIKKKGRGNWWGCVEQLGGWGTVPIKLSPTGEKRFKRWFNNKGIDDFGMSGARSVTGKTRGKSRMQEDERRRGGWRGLKRDQCTVTKKGGTSLRTDEKGDKKERVGRGGKETTGCESFYLGKKKKATPAEGKGGH